MTKPRRRPMTLARKRRIYAQHVDDAGQGWCGKGCGAPVPLEAPGVVYEHVVPFWLDPSKDDDGPNVQPWCPACSAAKNKRGGDPTLIAKTRRQIALAVDKPPTGERKATEGKLRGAGKLPGKGKGPKLRGRGFTKGGPKRRLPSRGFR